MDLQEAQKHIEALERKTANQMTEVTLYCYFNSGGFLKSSHKITVDNVYVYSTTDYSTQRAYLRIKYACRGAG